MSLGKVGTTRRTWFGVRTGSGAPRTGLTGANMTITVRNPGNTASDNPAPTEVGGGLYFFDIPGAFTTTHGVGVYGWVVEITTAPFDLLVDQIDYYVNDFDDLNTTTPPTAAAVSTAVWSEALPGAFGAGEAGERLATTDDTVGANLDATVSSRSTFDETTDPVEILDAGGAAGTSAAELVADIDVDLTANHGAGAWTTGASPAAIATAVWSEPLPGAFAIGEAGNRLARCDDNVVSILAATGLAARGSLVSDGATPDNLEVEAWLERLGEPITAGLVSATATLFNPDGTIVFGPTVMVLGAAGLFSLSVLAVPLADVTNFVLALVVTDATGAVVGYMATPTLA